MTDVTTPPAFRGGSGEPVVLIHGVTANWTWWDHLLPRLTPHINVLAPTLAWHPGGPSPSRPATISALADGDEAAMDEAGFTTAHLVGHSLGGWTAFELARRGRARSLVGINPAGGWWDQASSKRVLRKFYASYWPAKLGGPLSSFWLRFSWARALGFRGFIDNPSVFTRDQALRIMSWLIDFDLDVMRDFAADHRVEYPDPGVPCLLAWGERDGLFPKETYGAQWRKSAPYAEWRVVKNAGHDADVDQPDAIANLILEWVAGATPPSG